MEPKRITTIKVAPVPPEKKEQKPKKTFRFSLVLGESNKNQCPEYSFIDLVKANNVSIFHLNTSIVNNIGL